MTKTFAISNDIAKFSSPKNEFPDSQMKGDTNFTCLTKDLGRFDNVKINMSSCHTTQLSSTSEVTISWTDIFFLTLISLAFYIKNLEKRRGQNFDMSSKPFVPTRNSQKPTLQQICIVSRWNKMHTRFNKRYYKLVF